MLDKDSLYNNESKNEVENLKAFLPALIFSGIYMPICFLSNLALLPRQLWRQW